MATTPATTLRVNDRIAVTLAPTQGTARTSRNKSVSEMFDGAGYRLDHQGNRLDEAKGPVLDLSKVAGFGGTNAAPALPAFPMAEYQAALAETGNPNSDKCRGIVARHNIAVANGKAAGNGGQREVTDGIADAVLEFVSKEYSITLGTGGDDKAYLDPSKVIVKQPVRQDDGPAVFAVSLAPVWG